MSESQLMNSISQICHWMAMTAVVIATVRPALAEPAGERASTTITRVYISTYGTDRDGVYLAEVNPKTGDLKLLRRAATLKNVQFLALHPNHDFLYATCDVDDYPDTKGGAVTAFKVDASTGGLTRLNHQSAHGELPCHLTVDRPGNHALVANYTGGSVAVLPIRADGALGAATSAVFHEGSSIHKEHQLGPHPHAINLDSANRFALVADLGLDKVLVYRFDPTAGKLAPHEPSAVAIEPGAGPRHIAFHPDGKWVYVINELDSTVTALSYDSNAGALTLVDTVSTLPAGATVENITGEIEVHPNGKFVYGSNRGHDSIALFAIDQATGRLTSRDHFPAGGRTPRHFNIDPSGKILLSANMDSESITVHQIDAATGNLTRLEHEIKVPQPQCIEFLP
jgi:6-phosphogluconolactonase